MSQGQPTAEDLHKELLQSAWKDYVRPLKWVLKSGYFDCYYFSGEVLTVDSIWLLELAVKTPLEKE